MASIVERSPRHNVLALANDGSDRLPGGAVELLDELDDADVFHTRPSGIATVHRLALGTGRHTKVPGALLDALAPRRHERRAGKTTRRGYALGSGLSEAAVMPLHRTRSTIMKTTISSFPVGRLVVASTICLVACSSSRLPKFNDIPSAPDAIQTAANAVVRIQTATESGTGSFISPTGLLLTNNHILGDSICPIEGCDVVIAQMHQVGQTVQQPVHVFAVPVAVDVGLDMAVVQTFESRGGPQLESPDFLNVTPHDPVSLLGMHLTIVGHPKGGLKKWTDGVGVDAFGEWFATSAYTLPGDSGSPVLDDDGALVGIIHRGSTGADLVTSEGYDNTSIGTASASLLASMSAPLPGVMISTMAETTPERAVANDVVYLNGGTSVAMIGGAFTSVLALLGAACDAALARTDFKSPDDLATATSPCVDAMDWIECRSDAVEPAHRTFCPIDDLAGWDDRFQAMNDLSVAMNGNTDLTPITFGAAALETTIADGELVATQNLLDALDAAGQVVDFSVANYLAAFGIPDYGGTVIVDYVRGYTSVPHYELFGTNIASTALWLAYRGLISEEEAASILAQLHADPNVSVATKLYIEEALFNRGDSF